MSLRFFIFIVIAVSIPCFSGSLYGGVLHGKVIKVIDGDSIIVKTRQDRVEVRLYGIDAPEYDQPYAAKSKQITKRLLKGKKVDVRGVEWDRYDRLIAVVYQGKTCINGELVKKGGAWIYGEYCKKDMCREWKKRESVAKREKHGLWKGRNPIPPWRWRHEKH